jgi:hypothetical protein
MRKLGKLVNLERKGMELDKKEKGKRKRIFWGWDQKWSPKKDRKQRNRNPKRGNSCQIKYGATVSLEVAS